MPTQSAQQQANALNPTPTTLATPSQGQVYRSSSGGLYAINGNNLYMTSVGNAGSALKAQGIDYNNIPIISDYQLADMNRSGNGYNVTSLNNNSGGITDPSLLQYFKPSSATTSYQTVNSTPNSLATPDQYAASSAATTQQLAALAQTQAQNPSNPNAIPMGDGTPGGYFASSGGNSQLDAMKQQLLGAQSTLTGMQQAQSSGQPTQPTGYATTPSQSSGSTPQDSLLQQYLSQLSPSSDELNLQNQLNAITSQQAGINASRDLGIESVNEQPIATPFLTGQSTAITNRAAVQSGALGAQAVPLQQQLALAQAKRQSAVDITKAELDYNKPVSEAYGAQLVNPNTGQVVNGGLFGGSTSGSGVNPATGLNPASTSADILGYLVTNGVQPTRYNTAALINAVQNGATAQDIISGKVNVAAQTSAGTSGSSYKFDPATGTFVQANPSAASVSSSGSTSGYKAGQLTALLKAQGAPTDDASLAKLYAQIGGKGTYVNDTTHNAQIYAAMGGQPSSSSSSSGGSSSSNAPSSSSSSDPLSKLSGGAFTLVTTGDYQSGAYPAQKAAALAEARAAIPGFNPEIAKANASAISDQVSQKATVDRGLQALDNSYQYMVNQLGSAHINSNESPLANQLSNAVQQNYIGSAQLNEFQNSIQTLKTEYAQVVGRGGDTTDQVRTSANNLISGNYSWNDLKSLYNYIQGEGKTISDSYTTEIKNLSTGGGQSSNSSSSSGGSTYNGITLPN